MYVVPHVLPERKSTFRRVTFVVHHNVGSRCMLRFSHKGGIEHSTQNFHLFLFVAYDIIQNPTFVQSIPHGREPNAPSILQWLPLPPSPNRTALPESQRRRYLESAERTSGNCVMHLFRFGACTHPLPRCPNTFPRQCLLIDQVTGHQRHAIISTRPINESTNFVAVLLEGGQ